MVLSIANILTQLGVSSLAQRTTISDDILPSPGLLENLLDETENGIVETCAGYNRGEGNRRFRVSRTVVKKLISLMHWAKDKHRVQENIEFENGTTRATVLRMIAEATVRERCRKTQRKAGESLVNQEFASKLKNSAQWERWKVELSSTLGSIIGAKGVPLTYVIREADAAAIDIDGATWDKKFIDAIELSGPEYNIDRQIVHAIILRNVAEDSDAYTYIKPNIRRENGRLDMISLKGRYENQATNQERINEANRILDTLVYKNERALTFELFSSKIQGAVDALVDCNREPHDGDIVDKLWKKIQNPELSSFVEALKVQYSQQPRTFDKILQDIATQIPNLRKDTFKRNVSELKVGIEHTREGTCPTHGVFTAEGKLFVGNYPASRWLDDDVKEHHTQIIDIRKRYHDKKKKSPKQRASKANQAKRKIKKLTARISELERSVEQSKANNEGTQEDGAGNAFGGRNAKKKAKISQIVTYNRKIKQLDVTSSPTNNGMFVGLTELDTHADTIVAGKNTIVMSYTDKVCEVSPYSSDYESVKDVPIITAATGYTSATGDNYILILNEALYMPTLDHSLLNPNQLRHHGIEVQDNPYSSEPMTIVSHEDGFCACLESSGTNIYLRTWTPSQNDLESYPHIQLSSSENWDPRNVKFPKYSLSERSKIESRSIAAVKRIKSDEYSVSNENEIDCGMIDYNIMGINDDIISRLDILERNISEIKEIKKFDSDPVEEKDIMDPLSFISNTRHSSITSAELSDRWCISLRQANMTLNATTRRFKRSALMPLSRRYRVDRMFGLRYLDHMISTDTIDGKVKSLHGNRYAQVFGSKEFFCEVYPMEKKSEAGDMLDKFVRNYGVPKLLIYDGSREQCGRNSIFQRYIRKYNINSQVTEPERPNQNPVESVIRELKKRWFRIMYRSNCPIRLWDYGLMHVAALMNRTASNSGYLNGRTPLELITGETPDISEFLDFGFYDRVWYRENAGVGLTKLARWLGISNTVGSLMSYWVLPISGVPEARTTVQRITKIESTLDAHKEKFQEYDLKIKRKFKEDRLLPEKGDFPDEDEWDETFHKDQEFYEEFQKVYSNPEVKEEFTPDSFDPHIGMELLMDRGGNKPEKARVKRRLKDEAGNPIGKAHPNPIMDSRVYELEYEDGYAVPVSANTIVENLFNQVNDDGRKVMILDTIIGHRMDGSEVQEKDAYAISPNGIKRRKKTTVGHHVLLKWKDGSSTWHALKDVKDSYPVELAMYAKENGLEKLPAFAWWVSYVVRKQERIIEKLKSKYWSRTHKYGIRIPKSVKEALQIDKENGNTLWWDATHVGNEKC